MNIILIIVAILPQNYINLLMESEYEGAVNYCEEMIGKTKDYQWQLELGDIYYDKLDELNKAGEIYQNIIKNYKPKDGSVHYRRALILEQKEDYLNAAKEYEIVATQFRKFPLDSFALVGVERCFKKNYQDYVASVDGYNITRLELDEQIAKSSSFAKKDEKSVLDQMILERLLYSNALKYKVKDMTFYIENVANTKKSLILEEVRAVDVVAKATPTLKEMKNYYKKNKKNYKLREELRGKEIVVESDSLAKFLHDSLSEDITSFDTLAKLYSTAPTKNSGGIMVVNPGTKPKAVEDVIFKTKLKTLTKIVEFDNKFGIYLITEHKPEQYQKFEDIKSQIEASVRAEKTKDIEDKFLKNLKASANIEIFRDSFANPDSLTIKQDRIIAQINGRSILKSDVVKRNESQPQFGKIDLTKPEEFGKLLNLLIEEDLKLEWAEKNKYFLNEGYFTRLQETIKRTLDQGLYTKIVIEAVKVDSNEIKEYYNTHKEDLKIPETVRCHEIVVNSKESAEKIRKELLILYGAKSCLMPFFKKAAKVQDLAKFDSLAKEYSIATTKSRGGDTGLLRRGIKPEEFDKIAFNLKIGSISKVFLVGDSNYTIITLIEHNPSSYRTFEEVGPSIEANLRREKQRKTAEEFLTKIKESADIKIFLTDSEKEEVPGEKPEEPKPEEKKE